MAHVQIRNVSEQAHRRLKAEAAAAGQSLSEYLKAHLEEMARRPNHAELTERLREREPYLGPSITEIIREERDRR
jgi:plasmid stability protein